MRVVSLLLLRLPSMLMMGVHRVVVVLSGRSFSPFHVRVYQLLGLVFLAVVVLPIGLSYLR